MQNIVTQIENIDWQKITEEMHGKGFVVMPGLLTNVKN
jgi:hypothetical protein